MTVQIESIQDLLALIAITLLTCAFARTLAELTVLLLFKRRPSGYQPKAEASTPPPDTGSSVQPPAPEQDQPPQPSAKQEREMLILELEKIARTGTICDLCAHHGGDVNKEVPCRHCIDGGLHSEFVSRFRSWGEP